jgi:thiamine biosynthesis lipoprotein
MIPGSELQAVVRLEDKALATSGNYRRFYEENGVKYSHTIDPKTGYPVRHTLLSVTIIADDCMTADGFATACMVAGLEKAIDMIEKYDFLEAYLVYSDEEGNFVTWESEGMHQYTGK